jgi:tetratricopeptide (TPR) repeat protein
MKIIKFFPLFSIALMVGFGVPVLVGDASAGSTGTCMRKVNGVWISEPCASGGNSGSGVGSSGKHYTPPRPSPQELKNKVATRLMDKGLLCRKSGDYDCAIENFKEALERVPNYPGARNHLHRAEAGRANKIGLEYYNQGDWANALRYFKKAKGIYKNIHVRHGVIAENINAAEREIKREIDDAAVTAVEKAAEKKIAGMLDDVIADLGASNTSIYSQAKSTDSLGFIGSNKPLSSKRAKTSSVQGLRFISPQEEKGKKALKKLKFAPLPKPKGVSPDDAGAQLI